jgi:hypothetical protein
MATGLNPENEAPFGYMKYRMARSSLELYSPSMPFDHDEINKLCERLIACKNDGDTLVAAEELRGALHIQIEIMRSKVTRLVKPREMKAVA